MIGQGEQRASLADRPAVVPPEAPSSIGAQVSERVAWAIVHLGSGMLRLRRRLLR